VTEEQLTYPGSPIRSGPVTKTADQLTLEGPPIRGVLDMTAGLRGMQYEVRILASVNLDASAFRRVDVRGDFTKLPFRDNSFQKDPL
jgi:hypothetical protein